MVDEFAKANADKIKIIVQKDFDKAATAVVAEAANQKWTLLHNY